MKEGRQYVVQGIFIAVGLVFLARLFFLQVVADEYSSKAEKNVRLKVVQYPHRGQIYDRNGKLIVINAPVYDIMMIPKKVRIADTLAFCELMGLTKNGLDSIMRVARAGGKRYSPVKPYPFLKQVSNVDFARMQGGLIEYPGFYPVARTIRSYPKKIMANTLGYIGEISKKKLEAPGQNYYNQGDYIGISGIESNYEEQLRGQRGVKYVLVNVRGVEKGSFKNGSMDTASVAGENLISSVNIDIQQYAESLMINKIGSIVAIEPSTGEILTMVSNPSYDPNMLTGREFPVNFGPLQKDPLIPLYNRPIQAVYRPGSIFKLVQSLVGLQQGSINPTVRLPDVGPMACHHHSGLHNGLHNAIQYSCNVYFYQAFRQYIYYKETGNTFKDSERGLMRWRDAVGKFGFGRTLGIDLPNEKRGFVPDTSYFNRLYGKGSWKFSNWYSMAIGEGELGVVPLQMANLAAIIANRGYYYVPHLVKGIGKEGKIDAKYTTRNYVGVDSTHFNVVISGMEDVVRAGTAGLARIDSIIVCGKTGTSENKKGKDHSVFIAFAPKDNPKIAIAVYVENAGFGGVIAAPIASLIMEKYIKGKIGKRREYLEKFILEKNFMPAPVAPKPPVLMAKTDSTATTTKTVKKDTQAKPAGDSILVRDEKPARQ
jgi:penicillin-binding protein 2